MIQYLKRLSRRCVARARLPGLIFASALLATSAAIAGATSIWTNSAGGGHPQIEQWDMSGNLIRTIYPTYGNNGRGIVQVGDVIYYTSAGSAGVFSYNFVTSANLGVFYVTGATALSSIAYDGSSLYIQDYSNGTSNKVFKYTTAGVYQATLHLTNCSTDCDGLEFANGKLIANRSDSGGPYDLYNLSGGAPTALAFISDPNHSNTTGIAFDGTTYYVARSPSGQIMKFDATGAYLGTIMMPQAYYIEDISVDSAPGLLKICKIAGPGVPLGQVFRFDITPVGLPGSLVRVPAGPAPGGYCAVGPSFAQGQQVMVAEEKPGGYGTSGTVTAISAAPAGNLVSSSLGQNAWSLDQGIAHVLIGPGVTELTFTNGKQLHSPLEQHAPSANSQTGYLEICKIGNVQGNFNFTVTGVSGTITVPAGGCSPSLAVNPGNVTIIELPNPTYYWLPGNCCTTWPADRQVSHNDTAQSSTVLVVPGDISTETIAYIQNTVN